MNTFVALSVLLLVGLATGNPVPDDTFTITADRFFKEKFVIYTGENDITKIVVPLNEININDNTDIDNFDFYVFFIEAGEGLYVFKDGAATKVLANGKDISASLHDGSNKVFFGATDGIYTFNAKKKTAEKYGTLTDNIKNIAVINGTNDLYVLTQENVLYKVTEDGTKKDEVTDVKSARQIVLDTSNNLYFADSKKRVFIKSAVDGTVKRVNGLPENPDNVYFLLPPPVIEASVPFVVDDRVYRVMSNGKAQFTGLIFGDRVTAYDTEGTLALYMAYDKKIYKYTFDDIEELEREASLGVVSSFVNDKLSNIKEAAKKKTFHQ